MADLTLLSEPQKAVLLLNKGAFATSHRAARRRRLPATAGALACRPRVPASSCTTSRRCSVSGSSMFWSTRSSWRHSARTACSPRRSRTFARVSARCRAARSLSFMSQSPRRSFRPRSPWPGRRTTSRRSRPLRRGLRRYSASTAAVWRPRRGAIPIWRRRDLQKPGASSPACRDTRPDGSQRAALSSLAGMVKLVLNQLIEHGMVQTLDTAEGETYIPTPRYRLQVRELAANELFERCASVLPGFLDHGKG